MGLPWTASLQDPVERRRTRSTREQARLRQPGTAPLRVAPAPEDPGGAVGGLQDMGLSAIRGEMVSMGTAHATGTG
jgi:hypothetical protein